MESFDKDLPSEFDLKEQIENSIINERMNSQAFLPKATPYLQFVCKEFLAEICEASLPQAYEILEETKKAAYF